MTRNAATAGAAQAFVEQRRTRVLSLLGRTPGPGRHVAPLPADRLAHLRSDAEELYWNELVWEELTDEEAISGGHMTEMVFPGFLSFVDALLLDDSPADSPVPPCPRADAVEEILAFLGERWAEATSELEAGIDSQKVVWARMMTRQLTDLVLYRLYRLTPAERETLDRS
jgi:hypothetical protein